MQALSPALLQATIQVPQLAIVGGTETAEFICQIENGYDLSAQTDRYVKPEVDHINLIDRLASPDSQILQRIIAWLQ